MEFLVKEKGCRWIGLGSPDFLSQLVMLFDCSA